MAREARSTAPKAPRTRVREADSGRGLSILLLVLVFVNEECLDSTAGAI